MQPSLRAAPPGGAVSSGQPRPGKSFMALITWWRREAGTLHTNCSLGKGSVCSGEATRAPAEPPGWRWPRGSPSARGRLEPEQEGRWVGRWAQQPGSSLGPGERRKPRRAASATWNDVDRGARDVTAVSATSHPETRSDRQRLTACSGNWCVHIFQKDLNCPNRF